MQKVTQAQKSLMSIGQHLGIVVSEVNKKIERYILGYTNGRSILNLSLCEERLTECLQFLSAVRKNKGHVRIVATSPDSARIVLQIFDKQRKEGVVSLIVTRQIGGMLTDLPGFIKSYKEKKVKPVDLQSPAEKRDQAINLQQRENLVKYGNLPTARFVRNANDHGVAIKEANDCMIPVIGFVDTDCRYVENINYLLPGNTKSIECCHQLLNVISLGREEDEDRKEKEVKVREEKKKEEEKRVRS